MTVVPRSVIPQKGATGYLLWLRRDFPPVYQKVVDQFPAVAAFEAALTTQHRAGLGDDDLSPIDVTASYMPAVDDSQISVDLFPASESTVPSFVTDASFVPVPTLPPIQAAAIPSNAAPVSPASLATIGSFVASVLPSAITAAATVAGAVIAVKNVQVAQQTAALQLQNAISGRVPLQTGVTIGPNGQYLSVMSSSGLLGVPWWIWALGAVGCIVAVAS